MLEHLIIIAVYKQVLFEHRTVCYLLYLFSQFQVHRFVGSYIHTRFYERCVFMDPNGLSFLLMNIKILKQYQRKMIIWQFVYVILTIIITKLLWDLVSISAGY